MKRENEIIFLINATVENGKSTESVYTLHGILTRFL